MQITCWQAGRKRTKMITQTTDPHRLSQTTRRIKTQVATVLTKWGLLPRFNSWRLTRDPTTGLTALVGILDNNYFAAHTAIPFSDYFDPRLLNDFTNELQIQVVSCNSYGLRYAFILDHGSLGRLPSHIDFPFLDGDRLFVRVVYGNEPEQDWINPQALQTSRINVEMSDDRSQINRGVDAFLKIFDDIELEENVATKLMIQGLPDIVAIGQNEFNDRVAEHETDRQRSNRIRRLFTGTVQ
jgi:hypothetical protein